MFCVVIKEDVSMHKKLAIVLLFFFVFEFLLKWFIIGINGYFRDVRNTMVCQKKSLSNLKWP